jgi:preprotein translocase subunit SecF
VFSLAGFQITPDTVIALLTILGYSLYDTVVVFDRVRDNTGLVTKTGDMSYAEMVNLSMNQTLARSINTSLVAIFPVLSVLVVGAYILGATTLENYGLALVVGLLSGAYSSIFIASPLLSVFKSREPRMREVAERVAQRTDRKTLTPAGAAVMGADAPTRANASGARTASNRGTSPVQARARKRKRR